MYKRIGLSRYSFMHQKIKYFFFICISLFVGLFVSCSETDELISDTKVTPQVIFLFSPGGLGDMSYNDCILEGVQKFKRSYPEVDFFIYSPTAMEEADRIFSDWMKRPGSNIPVVFALASSDFEALVDKYLPIYGLTDNKRILLFESNKIYDNPKVSTFHVTMYGASFLAGAMARQLIGAQRSLILLGSSSDVTIEAAKDGFAEGFGGSDYDVEYLADDWTGYVMANVAYQKMSEWTSTYGYIFPVAGGSNTGLYRYTREYPDSPYLAGMDIDQSDLSNKITGSVVKRFDILVEEYFTEWLHTGEMPVAMTYGLDSGYVDWKLAPLYEEEFRDLTEQLRGTAIVKEHEYY